MYYKIDRLSPEIIDFLISKCPRKPTAQHFSNNTFPNINIVGVSRLHKIFCHHCLLFGRNIKKAWIRHGFFLRPRALISMQVHECFEAHSPYIQAKNNHITITTSIGKKNKQDIINKEIIQDLIAITFFLAKNCVAFRGHEESLKKELGNHSNFLDLIIFEWLNIPHVFCHT